MPNNSTARESRDGNDEIELNVVCDQPGVSNGTEDGRASDAQIASEPTWTPSKQVKLIVAGLASVIIVVGLDMTIFTVTLPVQFICPAKHAQTDHYL